MNGRRSRLGVLISGRGSNLLALMQAVEEGRLHADVAVVVSNNAHAGGLEHARQRGVEALVIDHRPFANRTAYDEAVADALRKRSVDLVCLAGFMRLLGRGFCEVFPYRILNIHPSLLPAFPGTDAQAQALEHGVKVAGATVHFVTPELDAGPIVLQRAVPVLESDTVETLAERILEVEHALYPDAVRRVLSRKWSIVGRRVVFADEAEVVR